jgi:hypothetical protein
MALNLPVNALAGNSKNLKIAALRLAACIIGPCSGPGGEYALLHARMPWQPYVGDAHVCSCSASLSLYYYKNHARYAPPAGFACGYIYYSGHLCTWQPACTSLKCAPWGAHAACHCGSAGATRRSSQPYAHVLLRSTCSLLYDSLYVCSAGPAAWPRQLYM